MAVLQRGDTGVAVADIRARLVRLRLIDPDTESSLDAAEYDDAVEQAVRAFQQQRGIPADG
ncbi:MAG: peptidoglycan-binding protein, partial [Candidatus Nanopelagicales bacterium]